MQGLLNYGAWILLILVVLAGVLAPIAVDAFHWRIPKKRKSGGEEKSS
jgi:hypothetical protein